jgi:hypothetical protein
MAGDDFNINVHPHDDDSEIGLDDDDLAIIEDAEQDDTKVVTKSPPKPYRLGYISVYCIIVNKMIGKFVPSNDLYPKQHLCSI